MGHKSKKAATEKTSGKSVQTYAAESTQEQPLTTRNGTTSGTALDAASAGATTTKSQSITATKKMLPEESQYCKAISVSSADLGKAIKKPTERIAKHVGDAIAHETKAKEARADARCEFEQNIAYYYEAKQRLLNPGYRTDVDGGKDRTPADNQKWFGAPNWDAFNEQCGAYSLQHADRKLKAFAKANGLLTDGGDNIDDPEQEEDEPEVPDPRCTPDPTAQKRYEHIAAAAMVIANRNPEGEIEKQILAAAEYVPTPLTPISADIFTEVLSFITKMASSVIDEEVKIEAKRLLGKMLIHRPSPEPARVLDAAQQEEQRKRGKRLAKKNGQALGSASYHPPNCCTPEYVQQSQPMPPAPGVTSLAAKAAQEVNPEELGHDEARELV